MPTRRPDDLPRGWLADKIRARAVRQKITDPEELEKHFDRIRAGAVRLGPGAHTIRRRGRFY